MILPKKDEVKPDNVVNHKSGFNKTKVNMQPVTMEKKEVKTVDIFYLKFFV